MQRTRRIRRSMLQFNSQRSSSEFRMASRATNQFAATCNPRSTEGRRSATRILVGDYGVFCHDARSRDNAEREKSAIRLVSLTRLSVASMTLATYTSRPRSRSKSDEKQAPSSKFSAPELTQPLDQRMQQCIMLPSRASRHTI